MTPVPAPQCLTRLWPRQAWTRMERCVRTLAEAPSMGPVADLFDAMDDLDGWFRGYAGSARERWRNRLLEWQGIALESSRLPREDSRREAWNQLLNRLRAQRRRWQREASGPVKTTARSLAVFSPEI